MINNKKGFSLPMAMGIVIVISLLAFAILEYIIPFSKEIVGVENSSKAYYQANSGIEEGLFHFSSRTSEKGEEGKSFSGSISNEYSTYSSGTMLPPLWEGNSEFDDNSIGRQWNQIGIGKPIQLSIGNSYITDWTDVNIYIRVPNLDNSSITDETLSGVLNIPELSVINWQISSIDSTLNANSTDIIKSSEVCESNDICELTDGINIGGLNGVDLEGNTLDIDTFYSSHCGLLNDCTLKFSVINKLETDELTTPVVIPYLEWNIDFDTNELPLRYSKIESAGKSSGYKKNLEVKVASKTVNEAFDFTVFQ